MPPGNPLIKPVNAVYKPPAAPYNPFNGLGVEGSGLPGQPKPYTQEAQMAPPAPIAAVAAAPPPIDFSTLVGTDPQYIRDQANAKAQNDLNVANLLKAFKGTAQGYQDNANAHGALFSGAAVHAQNYAAQGYADQAAQQAQSYKTGYDNNLSSAWQRILQQYAGG